MKTPSFWYKSRGLTAAVLLPLSFFFWLGGKFRHISASPYRARVPVICIGNIVAGGAGKTPATLAFGSMLLASGAKPVFVTLGYGGREKGPLRVDPLRHTALDVGDEALLLARLAPTWIGRDRVAAIKAAEQHGTHIILDDGLQNPSLVPNLAFLVIDGDTGFGNGLIIPAGPLRESFSEAMKRISAVILIGERDEQRIASRVTCPVLRANWQPNLPSDFTKTVKFLAFAGIGRQAKFYETCRKAGLTLVGTQDFPDHHPYTDSEIAALEKRAEKEGAKLLTTEKDWVRLSETMRKKITAFPVTLVFDDLDALSRFFTRL